MEAFFDAALLKDLSIVGLVVIMGGLVITRKLVWHTDLEKAEARAALWEERALTAYGHLDVAVAAAETSNSLVSRLPDPAREGKA